MDDIKKTAAYLVQADLVKNIFNYKIWFGKHQHKTLEQIALVDPNYFLWLEDSNILNRKNGALACYTLDYILNNFVPLKKCIECGGIAEYFSLFYIPNTKRIDYLCSPYHFCEEHKHYSSSYHPKAFPIKIKIRHLFKDWNTKKDFNKATKYFLEALGWDFSNKKRKPITKKNAQEFLSNITLNTHINKDEINNLLRYIYSNRDNDNLLFDEDGEDIVTRTLADFNDKELDYIKKFLEKNYDHEFTQKIMGSYLHL